MTVGSPRRIWSCSVLMSEKATCSQAAAGKRAGPQRMLIAAHAHGGGGNLAQCAQVAHRPRRKGAARSAPRPDLVLRRGALEQPDVLLSPRGGDSRLLVAGPARRRPVCASSTTRRKLSTSSRARRVSVSRETCSTCCRPCCSPSRTYRRRTPDHPSGTCPGHVRDMSGTCPGHAPPPKPLPAGRPAPPPRRRARAGAR